jgi:hypothetical protein
MSKCKSRKYAEATRSRETGPPRFDLLGACECAVDGGAGDFGGPAVLHGLLLALVGLIHSLSASWSELRLSSGSS